MAILLVAVLGFLAIIFIWWMLSRALDGRQQMEAGGSYGRQVFGRDRKPEKPEDDGQT